MKPRAFLAAAVFLLLLGTPGLWAAEEHGEAAAESSNTLIFQIVNFAILAGLLGYLIKKNLGPYFAERSQSIRQHIVEAQALLKQSEERAVSIEARVANIDHDVSELRDKARAELAAELARLEQEAEQSIRRISAQAAQEMEAATKAARLELRAYAASLAVGLAEKKLEGRVDASIQKALVDDFIRGLHTPGLKG